MEEETSSLEIEPQRVVLVNSTRKRVKKPEATSCIKKG